MADWSRAQGGYRWRFAFDEMDIDNEILESEAVELKQSLGVEGEDLKLGGCVASELTFTVHELEDVELVGQTFDAYLTKLEPDGTDSGDTEYLGTYIVDSATMSDDRTSKKVVAYDILIRANKDVSAWYDSVADLGLTIRELRQSLLDYCGIPYVEQTLVNDGMVIGRTLSGEVNGLELLRGMCAASGCFGYCGSSGGFEVAVFGGQGTQGSWPSDNTYPGATVYPGYEGAEVEPIIIVADDEGEPYPEYRRLKHEPYITKRITNVIINPIEGTQGAVCVPETLGDNPLVISGNYCFFGASTEDLTLAASSILNALAGYMYVPLSVTLPVQYGVKLWTPIEVHKADGGIVQSIVMNRTIKGIQNCTDTYESHGNEYLKNVTSLGNESMRNNGKGLKIEKSVDALTATVFDEEEGLVTKMSQTVNGLSFELSDAGQAKLSLNMSYTKSDGSRVDLDSQEITIRGLVTFESLKGEGTTEINGGNIIASTITAEVHANNFHMDGGSIQIETADTTTDVIKLNYNDTASSGSGFEYEISSKPVEYRAQRRKGHGDGSYSVDESVMDGAGFLAQMYETSQSWGGPYDASTRYGATKLEMSYQDYYGTDTTHVNLNVQHANNKAYIAQGSTDVVTGGAIWQYLVDIGVVIP